MEIVNVAVRVRPSLNVHVSSEVRVLSADPPVLFANDRHYTFDNIFTEDAQQKEFYNEMVKPLLGKVLSGYNSTVFAYGQTGTGKTYTIGSNPEAYQDAGFIVRALDEVFDSREEHIEIAISVSFFEIYNEKVYDLLGTNSVLVVKGFQVQGLTVAKVNNSLEAQELLKLGNKNRHTGETNQNRNSSRSHAIFSIHCNVKHENSETEAKLNLVDLAGSESVRKTGCKGSQFEEGVNINKGLLQIGMVINALSTNQNHIPYRGSMLTTILQDSLDKRNYITFVACISPDPQDIHETVQTLQFAQRAKKLKNKPEVNSIVQQYKRDNPGMFERQLLGSAVKVRATPSKRQNYHSLQYSESKKPKITPNRSWTPLNSSIESNKLSPTSSISVMVSSISNMDDMTPAMLPPLRSFLQKYTEMSSTVQKLECLIRSQSRRPSPNRRNTSRFAWQLLQAEFDCMQFPGRKSQQNSDPVTAANMCDLRVVPRRLEFNEGSSYLDKAESPEFAVPTALPRKIKKARKKRAPDEDIIVAGPSISAKAAPRRSVRLSLRKPVLPAEESAVKRRQSTRLLMKIQKPPESERDVLYPIPAPRKKVKRAAISANSTPTSPTTSHNQYVLNILNTGDQKILQKLPLVGLKTATQIYVYRKIHGQFSSIADLGKMESWRGNSYQRFLKANFLKTDDD